MSLRDPHDKPSPRRIRNINESELAKDVAECATQSPDPKREVIYSIQRLEDENSKLRAQVAEQERELLHLYRFIHDPRSI